MLKIGARGGRTRPSIRQNTRSRLPYSSSSSTTSKAHLHIPPRIQDLRSTSTSRSIGLSSSSVGAVAVVVIGVGIWSYLGESYLERRTLLADSKGDNKGYETQSQLHGGKVGTIQPGVFVWGRNTHNVAAPEDDKSEMIKKPKMIVPFDGAVLRDLAIHGSYGVAVDAKGDVLQWGIGFTTTEEGKPSIDPSVDVTAPHPTLKNHDIVRVAPSDTKIFALSRKGEIYVFPAELEKQRVGRGKGNSSQGLGSWWKLGWLFGTKDVGTDMEKLKTDVKLASGERFSSISIGNDHLLALTSAGRSFALPINLSANTYGQLGVTAVSVLSCQLVSDPSAPPSQLGQQMMVPFLPDVSLNEINKAPPLPTRLDPLLEGVFDPATLPKARSPEPMGMPNRAVSQPIVPNPEELRFGLTQQTDTRSSSDAFSGSSAESTGVVLHPDPAIHSEMENNIRFATILCEIPILKGVRIAQLVAGGQHSLARTAEGRVLAWGANGYGQLGLGTSLSFPFIPTPTEIPLIRCYPKATRLAATKVGAGDKISYFIVEREDIANGKKTIDLLATGNGQFGGIGNGTWAHAASPVKVKTISGLQEWSEKEGKIAPIPIKELAVGKNHVAIVLDNAVEQPGGIKFGRDVFVWGHNEHYQLGTGKRSNLATPQHLPPLPYPGLSAPLKELTPGSGTVSPMPHSRLQLVPEMKVNGVMIEETIVAGDSATAVYWRILKP